ncbi:MAG TPA: hypothetical protein VLE22_27920 [Bryobacteraceae bacterium]|nr:hypothetical protein [Bryobacteraceae bacterium]
MRSVQFIVLTGLVVAGVALGQSSESQAPIADNPKVEVKGKIEKIRIARGQGMPSLDLNTGDRTVSVILGSMRYLVEQDFNPKAGEEVVVSGYKVNDGIVAVTVTLAATGRLLRLRDDGGRPLWIGGRRGAPMHRRAK